MLIETNKEGLFAVIDDGDFDLVKGYRWNILLVDTIRYAVAWPTKRGNLLMHRLIMDAKKGQFIDHKDRNGLNNSRSNLRFATRQQNRWNSKGASHNASGFKGVRYCPERKTPFRARFQGNGLDVSLGSYSNAEDAHKAWVTFAKKQYGEFFNAGGKG